jgi:hypothetical protein
VSDECTCGRLRPTAADLERWDTEATRGDEAAMLSRFAWSRARCFYPGNFGVPCATRTRWASETHIGAARSVFAQYMDDLAEFLRGEGAAAWALS